MKQTEIISPCKSCDHYDIPNCMMLGCHRLNCFRVLLSSQIIVVSCVLTSETVSEINFERD